jgi:hypothetical protein
LLDNGVISAMPFFQVPPERDCIVFFTSTAEPADLVVKVALTKGAELRARAGLRGLTARVASGPETRPRRRLSTLAKAKPDGVSKTTSSPRISANDTQLSRQQSAMKRQWTLSMASGVFMGARMSQRSRNAFTAVAMVAQTGVDALRIRRLARFLRLFFAACVSDLDDLGELGELGEFSKMRSGSSSTLIVSLSSG